MNKKIILRLLLLSTVSLFFLNSCRTDETMQEEKRTEREKIEAFVRFENNLTPQKRTQKNTSEYISYHEPFKEIIQAFMHKNPTFAQEFQNEVGDIYFNLRSLTYGETSKVIAYPIMKDDKVNAFIIGIVNPQRDWVNFTVAKDDTPEVQRIISKFQNYYNSTSVTSRGGREAEQPIEEIVIIVPNAPGPITTPYVDHNGYGNNMSGGGPSYGGSGSGSSSQSQNNFNPCEQTKNLLQDQKIKAITDDLKNHMATGKGEKGWRDNKTGDPTETTQNGDHSVNFGDPSTMNGGYHNHTGTKIDIFSATDIAGLIEIARYQNVGNASNAYMGIMAPGGIHYVMYFNGNQGDLPANPLYNNTDEWNYYQVREQWDILDNDTSGVYCDIGEHKLNAKGLERIFLSTLRRMKLENKVIIQKIENNNIFNISQYDGSIVESQCQ